MQFIRRLGLRGLLSFPPGMEPFDLRALNVLIGPNGSGKSNVIEALDLLRATPVDFAAAIRDGGGAAEWLWKGERGQRPATIDVETGHTGTGLATPTGRPLRYRLEFAAANNRVEVLDEAVEEAAAAPGRDDPRFYYRFQRGKPVINVRDGVSIAAATGKPRHLRRDDLLPDQSVLAQRKDPELYPEVTWIGRRFGEVQMFRDWTFGRYARLRQPQPADLPEDRLLSDSRNLALVLNHIEYGDPRRLNDALKRFFPRFDRVSTRIAGGAVQFYLHEAGLSSPIPSTRLSDGTIRFIAILATLLAPSPPPLVCIEEPELGMHPDAVALIGGLLAEVSERMQLVVTTHSDALLSALTGGIESVLVCEHDGYGTTVERLDAGRLASWLEEYTLGDIWRTGEIGGNP